MRPLEAVARFVGGYADDRPRPVTVIRSTDVKELRTAVRFPAVAVERAPDQWWPAIAEAVREIVAGHRSTLVFTNTRRHCEKLTLLLNRGQTPPLAYAHHGSLSRETRAVVESRLKRGELRAIVATASLELGIDIGALDEVVLVETPPSVSSAVQRIGRAGHAVGEISRGTLFPLHGRDFLHRDHTLQPQQVTHLLFHLLVGRRFARLACLVLQVGVADFLFLINDFTRLRGHT